MTRNRERGDGRRPMMRVQGGPSMTGVQGGQVMKGGSAPQRVAPKKKRRLTYLERIAECDVSEELKVSVSLALKTLETTPDMAELELPSSLTAEERKYVHIVSQQMGFKSKSRGEGAGRRIVLMKKSDAEKPLRQRSWKRRALRYGGVAELLRQRDERRRARELEAEHERLSKLEEEKNKVLGFEGTDENSRQDSGEQRSAPAPGVAENAGSSAASGASRRNPGGSIRRCSEGDVGRPPNRPPRSGRGGRGNGVASFRGGHRTPVSRPFQESPFDYGPRPNEYSPPPRWRTEGWEYEQPFPSREFERPFIPREFERPFTPRDFERPPPREYDRPLPPREHEPRFPHDRDLPLGYASRAPYPMHVPPPPHDIPLQGTPAFEAPYDQPISHDLQGYSRRHVDHTNFPPSSWAGDRYWESPQERSVLFRRHSEGQDRFHPYAVGELANGEHRPTLSDYNNQYNTEYKVVQPSEPKWSDYGYYSGTATDDRTYNLDPQHTTDRRMAPPSSGEVVGGGPIPPHSGGPIPPHGGGAFPPPDHTVIKTEIKYEPTSEERLMWDTHGTHDTRGPDMRGPDMRGSDMRGPDMRGPDMRGPDMNGPDLMGPPITVKSEPQF